ncbi:hypothetical protein D0Y65_029543 [Glycine soja]|uniref:Uncharacterized protein n=1 Tax=Glycine soja TaxID=3848 RepID=A0A445HZK9_GLYSO|nr:hypothetical protein D0Y65_029543 [Glycine soja]RZB79281.1 hypothetical protein D0Y65_029543 [Glycine soja]
MNIMSTHQCSWPVRIQDHPDKGSINKAPFSRGSEFLNVGYHAQKYGHSARKCRPIFASSVSNSMDPSDSDDTDKKKPQNGEMGGVNSEMLRESLEKIVGEDDSTFSGFDLATLIRNKYGRSYDVQLIKKEFMGRNLLAMNVMWKYMEQVLKIQCYFVFSLSKINDLSRFLSIETYNLLDTKKIKETRHNFFS